MRQRSAARLQQAILSLVVFLVLRPKGKNGSASLLAGVHPRGLRAATLEAHPVVGDRAEALFWEDGEWYPCRVEKQNDDGSLHVRWDNPGNGPKVSDCWMGEVRELDTTGDFKVGDLVRAVFPEDGAWYNGTVEGAEGVGHFRISWDDPDGGPASSLCNVDSIKKVEVFKAYEIGDAVQAMYSGDGQRCWYPGVIHACYDDRTFEVRWDDPGDAGGPNVSHCLPRYMKPVVVYKDYQVGDMVDVFDPDTQNWHSGFVGDCRSDGSFIVKWQEPVDGYEACRCGPQDMRGVHREYSVGDAVEARSPDDYDWHPGVVEKDHGCGTFDVRWRDGGHAQAVSLCTPEEMVLMADDTAYEEEIYGDMQQESFEYGWGREYSDDTSWQGQESVAEEEDSEAPKVLYQHAEVLASAPSSCARADQEEALVKEIGYAMQLGGHHKGPPRKQKWMAWMPSIPRLTLRPRRRGSVRLSLQRSPSRLSGWTSKRWACEMGKG